MKTKKTLVGLMIAALLTIGIGLQSFTIEKDKNKIVTGTLNVKGVCEMCTERIESAMDAKGIVSSSYSLEKHELLVKYKTKKIDLAKIEQLILKVGHDVNNKTADDNVYNNLPGCCKYRTLSNH